MDHLSNAGGLFMVNKQLVHVIGPILVLCFVAVHANAQLGGINGRICDENGAVIPGVNVNFRSDSGKTYSTMSNDDGEYRLKLPSGLYQISVEHSPFTSYRLADYFAGKF